MSIGRQTVMLTAVVVVVTAMSSQIRGQESPSAADQAAIVASAIRGVQSHVVGTVMVVRPSTDDGQVTLPKDQDDVAAFMAHRPLLASHVSADVYNRITSVGGLAVAPSVERSTCALINMTRRSAKAPVPKNACRLATSGTYLTLNEVAIKGDTGTVLLSLWVQQEGDVVKGSDYRVVEVRSGDAWLVTRVGPYVKGVACVPGLDKQC